MNKILQSEIPKLSSLCLENTACNADLPTNKENLLELTIIHLESERDNLLNTVADLRQLIKRITVQQDQESIRKHNIQLEYARKIHSLEQALKISEKYSF